MDRTARSGCRLCRFVKRLFLLTCVLIAGFALVGYAAGWIEVRYDRQEKKAVIEVQAEDMREAAESAAERGRRLVDGFADRVEGETPSATDAEDPGSTPPEQQVGREDHD